MQGKIMTAEEFSEYIEENSKYTFGWEEIAIRFAKYHVEKALKEASYAAEIKDVKYSNDVEVCKDSIIKSYPLTNIK